MNLKKFRKLEMKNRGLPRIIILKAGAVAALQVFGGFEILVSWKTWGNYFSSVGWTERRFVRLSAAPEPLFRHTVLEFDCLHFKRKISRQKGTKMDRKNLKKIYNYPSQSSNQKFL